MHLRAPQTLALLALALLVAGCATPATDSPQSSTSAAPTASPTTSRTVPVINLPPGPDAVVNAISTRPECTPQRLPFVLRIMAATPDLEAGRTDAFLWVTPDGQVIDTIGTMHERPSPNGTVVLVQGPYSAFRNVTVGEICSRLAGDVSSPDPAAWLFLGYNLTFARRSQLPPAEVDNLTRLLDAEFFTLPRNSSQTSCSGGGYGRWTVVVGERDHDVQTQCVREDPNGDDAAAERLGRLADKVGEILQRAA